MGRFTNSRSSNIFGFTALVLMTAAAGVLIFMRITET